MRGDDLQQGAMFSYLSPEQRVPADHPLRPIRRMVASVLARLSPLFAVMYADGGRPSIAPEKLLRTLVLQCLYSVRSERLLMEQLDDNLSFRWFVGLNVDDPIRDFTVFSKNRVRLLAADVARAFFTEVGVLARERGLLSDEHLTVDGTLIEAWASQKSFKPQGQPNSPPPTPARAIPAWIFAGSLEATTRTPRPPMRTRGCTKRLKGRSRNWPFSALTGDVQSIAGRILSNVKNTLSVEDFTTLCGQLNPTWTAVVWGQRADVGTGAALGPAPQVGIEGISEGFHWKFPL